MGNVGLPIPEKIIGASAVDWCDTYSAHSANSMILSILSADCPLGVNIKDP
jgi:hypothetical protein